MIKAFSHQNEVYLEHDSNLRRLANFFFEVLTTAVKLTLTLYELVPIFSQDNYKE